LIKQKKKLKDNFKAPKEGESFGEYHFRQSSYWQLKKKLDLYDYSHPKVLIGP
jgi:hypothetical protein